jgi:hypothetical protein
LSYTYDHVKLQQDENNVNETTEEEPASTLTEGKSKKSNSNLAVATYTAGTY